MMRVFGWGVTLKMVFLALSQTSHAFTPPMMMSAPRFAAAGLPHLRMAAAGHGVSAFSLAPALGMGCAAGALAGLSRMPSKSSSLCMSSGGIGGGSISGGGGGGGGGGGDDNSKLPANILAILSAKNIAASALPKDIAAAVVAGRVGATEVAAWASMYTGVWRKLFCKLFFFFGTGIRDRIMANDRFMLVMGLELAIGCVSKMAAEWRERNSRGAFFKELDFVASDMALEVIGDFTLVYLLSPFAVTRAPATAGLGALIGALPAHFLAPGAFTAAQRGGALLYKGTMFWMVGFLSSVIGHSSTVALMQARGIDTSAMAPVLDNSVQWGNFMGVSSNIRYQLVNGWERNLLPLLKLQGFVDVAANLMPLLKLRGVLDVAVPFVVRFSNCYIGGEMWMWWAKKVGLQGEKKDKEEKKKK